MDGRVENVEVEMEMEVQDFVEKSRVVNIKVNCGGA